MTKNITLMTCDFKPENCHILGIVRGCSVKAANAIKDVVSNIKNLTGGDLTHYSDLIDISIEDATNKMKSQALALNADAVVAVRFATSNVTSGGAEIIVYGTAVRFFKENQN